MKDVSVMIDEVKFNLRAGIMITCGDEILIEINPEIDFVTLPGGRIKTLESTKEGLIREMKEEMNYEIPNDIEFRGMIENFFEYEKKKYHELYFLYKYEISSNDKTYFDNLKNVDSKNHYFTWVKKSELSNINLLPVVIKDWALNDGFDQEIINDLPDIQS